MCVLHLFDFIALIFTESHNNKMATPYTIPSTYYRSFNIFSKWVIHIIISFNNAVLDFALS
jgi:hypothetical protein